MDIHDFITTHRKQFKKSTLSKSACSDNPFNQFEVWLNHAISHKVNEPYAMQVATVSKNQQPSTRILYLRDFSSSGFVFYTNYNSQKGKDISINSMVCLSFFWPELERQIHIYGEAQKQSSDLSDKYFNSRPRTSQIGAWSSNQSVEIRHKADLMSTIKKNTEKFKSLETIPRPKFWGGYLVIPSKIEFWQGGEHRLHDRIVYNKIGNEWSKKRLMP